MPTRKRTKRALKPLPNADEVLLKWLEMGPSRSFAGVRQIYEDDPRWRPPSLGTIRNWSCLQKWPPRAIEHDGQASGLARRAAIQKQASEQHDAAEKLEFVSKAILDRMLELLPDVTDPKELNNLSEITRELLEVRETLIEGSRAGEPTRSPNERDKRVDEASKKLGHLTGNGQGTALQ